MPPEIPSEIDLLLGRGSVGGRADVPRGFGNHGRKNLKPLPPMPAPTSTEINRLRQQLSETTGQLDSANRRAVDVLKALDTLLMQSALIDRLRRDVRELQERLKGKG